MTLANFAQPDVTLRLDLDGIIRRADLSEAMGGEGLEAWVGRPWAETVSEGGNAQVLRMLDDARTSGLSSFHQVRQRFPSGLEIALEYATVRLGEGGLIAIGRSLEVVSELRARFLATQTSMERDAWRLREVETRYRLLFDASAQPVLLIDANDTRVVEANPAAVRALGRVSDLRLLPELAEDDRDGFAATLERVREQGKAPGVVVHLGPHRQAWLVRASLVDAGSSATFVLQLSPTAATLERSEGLPVEELIARLPEGFVVVDGEGVIRMANRAFRELVAQPADPALVGQPVDRWLARPGADLVAIRDHVHRSGVLSGFASALRRASGEIEVELSAATTGEFVGILVRRRSRSLPAGARSGPEAKALLREMVQEAVASVEQSCIDAVEEIRQSERERAAQLLAMRRRDLHDKLTRQASETGAANDEPDPTPGDD